MAVGPLRVAAAAALRGFIEAEAADFPALRWVWHALKARGKLLTDEGVFAWGLLPPLVTSASGGDPLVALPLGTALECFVAAADVLDDVEDADATDALWVSSGAATAINVATYLLQLTPIALGQLAERGVPLGKVVNIMRLFAASGARACVGQQRDLDAVGLQPLDEEEYLATISLKSASLVSGACRAAAVLAVDDPNVSALYAEFGLNVGLAMQIGNDVVGASRESGNRDDLVRGKLTLPVIFALEYASPAAREEALALLSTREEGKLAVDEVGRLRRLIASTGALEYCQLMADVHWERALDCLRRAGCPEDSDLVLLVAEMRGGSVGKDVDAS